MIAPRFDKALGATDLRGISAILLCAALVQGCGVKGDPLPVEKSADKAPAVETSEENREQ